MKRMRIIGLAIAAVFALTAIASSAASAHEFEASKAGKLKRVSNTTQVFTASSSHAVECTTDGIVKGEAKAGKQTTVKVEVSYSGCHVVVFGIPFEATVSNAKYEFNANEFANLENTVTISVPVAGCTITVPAQSNLKTVKYENTPTNDVTVNAAVTGIKSTGSGGECGTGESTTGTYTGKTVTELEGGSIKWV